MSEQRLPRISSIRKLKLEDFTVYAESSANLSTNIKNVIGLSEYAKMTRVAESDSTYTYNNMHLSGYLSSPAFVIYRAAPASELSSPTQSRAKSLKLFPGQIEEDVVSTDGAVCTYDYYMPRQNGHLVVDTQLDGYVKLSELSTRLSTDLSAFMESYFKQLSAKLTQQ